MMYQIIVVLIVVFGTMEDFEEMVIEAKKLGIDVMLDMVFNHTSIEHKWFKKAMNGDEKYKNYYIFKEPKNGDKANKLGFKVWWFNLGIC